MRSLTSACNGISGILVCLCLVTPATAGAAQFKVRDAEVRLVDGSYLVDARFSFEFSPEAIEALENGVPLTVTVDMQVLRKRRFLWAQRVAKRQARWSLEVHPLSGQYVLKDLDSGEVRTFPTLESATQAMSVLRGYPLLERNVLDADGKYRLRVRARLDIEALPAPLRPLAYLSAPWRLTSEWSESRLEP